MKKMLMQIATFLGIANILVDQKGKAIFTDDQKKKLMSGLKLDDKAYEKLVLGINSALANQSATSASETEFKTADRKSLATNLVFINYSFRIYLKVLGST